MNLHRRAPALPAATVRVVAFSAVLALLGLVPLFLHRPALLDGFRTLPWWSAREAPGLVAGRDFGFLACFLRDGDDVYETWWTTGRGTEAMAWSYDLLDRTVYGRQESWEDSPEGWPQPFGVEASQFRTAGRPTIQWSVTDEPVTDATAHCH